MSTVTDHEKLSTEVEVTVDESALSVDPVKVLRKLDLRLVPAVCILYLLCYL